MMNEKYSKYFISGHNDFSDLTSEEFRAMMTGGSISPEGSISRALVQKPDIKLPQNLQSEDKDSSN